MKRLIKRVIPSLSPCGVFYFQSGVNVQVSAPWGQSTFNVSQAQKTVLSYVDSINKKDWNTYISLQLAQDQSGLEQYFEENDQSSQGILSVNSTKIQEIENFPTESFEDYVNYDSYENMYGMVYGFLVDINYNVKNESKYYYNGDNYELILVDEENNIFKIILDMFAPVDSLESAGYGFNTESEKNDVKILADRREGIYEDANGKLLSVNRMTASSSNSVQPDSAPAGYTNELSTIKVSHVSTYQIETVSFDVNYVEDVESNEWEEGWNLQALDAGALIIKAYAWNYIIYGTSKARTCCADILDSTADQVYVKGSSQTHPNIELAVALEAAWAIGTTKF